MIEPPEPSPIIALPTVILPEAKSRLEPVAAPIFGDTKDALSATFNSLVPLTSSVFVSNFTLISLPTLLNATLTETVPAELN